MSTLLDLSALAELYPDLGARGQFLRRALELLRADRVALQDALARHAYADAGELAHRLRGSAAFLTGEPERSAALLAPLEQAIKYGMPPESQPLQDTALAHLMALEFAIEDAMGADMPTRTDPLQPRQ